MLVHVNVGAKCNPTIVDIPVGMTLKATMDEWILCLKLCHHISRAMVLLL